MELCHFFAESTINTLLLMTDGTMFWKDTGNPSGFPGTLCLNCIDLLIAYCYSLIVRLMELDMYEVLEQIYLSVCSSQIQPGNSPPNKGPRPPSKGPAAP